MANNNPLGVALRVRRNCSDRIENDQIFKRKLVKYKVHLMHSGYKSNLIYRKFLKVVKKKRSKAIANKEVDLKCGSRKYNRRKKETVVKLPFEVWSATRRPGEHDEESLHLE